MNENSHSVHEGTSLAMQYRQFLSRPSGTRRWVGLGTTLQFRGKIRPQSFQTQNHPRTAVTKYKNMKAQFQSAAKLPCSESFST